MMRRLSTVVLGGILGSIVLVGDAQACHGRRCGGCATPVCSAPCVRTAVCPQPAPCVYPTSNYCRPRFRLSFNFCRPRYCHRTCGTCGGYGAALACNTGYCYRTVAPTGQAPVATPQTSAQH
jgi:hypothetical protein